MINIWFMAAKVVLVLTESSLLHCSIFPVPPSQRNTVRTWIFYFLQGQHVFATFCTRSVSNLFHFCQYDLSIRLLSSSIPKRSLLLCYLSAWTPSAEMSFWECLATFLVISCSENFEKYRPSSLTGKEYRCDGIEDIFEPWKYMVHSISLQQRSNCCASA